MKVALIIPTYNSARCLPQLLEAVQMQSRQPDEIIVVDSNSRDETQQMAAAAGARVLPLGRRKFNHSGTRKWAIEQTDADVAIFLTHDAIPASPVSFANIIGALVDTGDSGMAYGRQLPHKDASPFATHHRCFNYPEQTIIKRKSDIPSLGMKTCFASDSFAAYRTNVLDAIGGFPEDLIFGEDAWVAGRMLLAGYAVVYAADATVFHSHNYSISEEFRRHFDAGVFHSRNTWIGENFGGASSEGLRFVRSEIAYLLASNNAHRIPKALMATVCKLAGFRAGYLEKFIPLGLKRRLSMFSAYWV
jgi:rhamnosyltransferase